MKLEKREISLNEYDSLTDAFYMQKLLLIEYAHALAEACKRQTRDELVKLVIEVCEDMSLMRDLMEKSTCEREE